MVRKDFEMTTAVMNRGQTAPLYDSLQSRLIRRIFNFFPPFRGSGARVTYIARDWREVRVRLPLNLWTRNYMGSIYGGSIYAAIDPMYMFMLYQNLGTGYIVWDKAATIQFKKPGRTTLYATFKLEEAEVLRVQAALESRPTLDCSYEVKLVDKDGVEYACIQKIVYVKKK